jgi:hypothetical protein
MTYPADIPTHDAQALPSEAHTQGEARGEAKRHSAQCRCPSCGTFTPSTIQGWTRRRTRAQSSDGSEVNDTRSIPYTSCASCGRGPILIF